MAFPPDHHYSGHPACDWVTSSKELEAFGSVRDETSRGSEDQLDHILVR